MTKKQVSIKDLDRDQLPAILARLDVPWIADEGPLDARFRRVEGELETEELLPRGLAFDVETTVEWDEAGVRVVRESDDGEQAWSRQSKARVRKARFGDSGLAVVCRIDYLHRGVLLASRYLPGEEDAQD